MSFEIIKDHNRGWIVIRQDGEYKQHAHISSKQGCMLLIRLLKRKQIPRSDYLKESARRLLTEYEYGCLRKPKDRYVNKR